MATKEVAVAGTVIAGGGAGGGYAAYRYLSPENEEEKPGTTDESASTPSTTKTIKQQLDSTGNDEKGKAISGHSDENNWWKKADHRYYLEISDDGDKISEVGDKSLRDSKYSDKSETLKAECNKLTSASYSDDNDSNFKKAKKWCTIYKTVKETLGDDKKSKNLKENNDAGWKGKYEELEKENDLKKVLEGIKKEFESESDDANKKQKTVHKWCEIALDASDSYQFKDKVRTVCVFAD